MGQSHANNIDFIKDVATHSMVAKFVSSQHVNIYISCHIGKIMNLVS